MQVIWRLGRDGREVMYYNFGGVGEGSNILNTNILWGRGGGMGGGE
jgi:hypothetical protein